VLEGITTPQLDGPAAESSSFRPAAMPPPKRTRKIAILGFGRTVKDCPWKDQSWELWAMNGFWRAATPDYGIDAPEERYSLWFDMHSVEYTRAYGKVAGFGDQQEKWLQQEHPFPILMLDEDPAFPSVRAFPIDELVEQLGRDYFTSTVAYALAFALAQPDVAEIALFGIDLAHDTEYAEQQPCAAYWAGRAEGIGIRLTVHRDSALLKGRYRYGYECQNPLLTQLRAEILKNLEVLDKQIADGKQAMDEILGKTRTNDGAKQFAQAVLDRLDVWERGGNI